MSRLLTLAVLALPIAYLAQPGALSSIKPFLRPALSLLPFWHGMPFDPAEVGRHEDLLAGEPFGTEGCEMRFKGVADACEDGQVHYPSHTAIWACGTIYGRQHFWPPFRLYNRTSGRQQDYVVTYNMETNKVQRLKTPGYNGELNFHGMGIWYAPDKQNEVYIFLVNHKSEPQSCITIFKHTIGTDSMEFFHENCDPLIVSPNDVAPTGPKSFYMANAHRFNDHGRGGLQGFLARIENELGQWQWTNVIYCDGTNPCRKVAGNHVGANGVLLVGDLLYVDDWQGAFVAVYKREKDDSLTFLEKIPLGSPIDNLSYDPKADAFLGATFPSVPRATAHLWAPRDHVLVPFTITRIKRAADPAPGKTKHEATIIMYSDKMTGSVSTALSDASIGKSVVGGIVNEGLLVCDRALAEDVNGIPA
ncbi:hypothetical protein DFJ74DRAFT_693852 [Hyaloraphidium curvatum]|nr:hypothetical protein DFJ74DRAFT_693852 [Hyaloraphidium curvatum]